MGGLFLPCSRCSEPALWQAVHRDRRVFACARHRGRGIAWFAIDRDALRRLAGVRKEASR